MSHRGGRIRPPRRGVIGQAKIGPVADEFQSCWDLLREALISIHTKNAGTLSFEQLYRASYKIVLKKKAGVLYDSVTEFEETWFRQHVVPPIEALLSKSLVSITLVSLPGANSSTSERRQLGEKFLNGIRVSWEDHNTAMNMIADILMYLDRTYTTDNNCPSLWASTIGLFRDNVLRAGLGHLSDALDEGKTIFSVVSAVVFDLINLDRDGEVVDRRLVHAIVNMLEMLYATNEEVNNQTLYLTQFEPELLDVTRDYYKKEAQTLLRESNASNWLRHTRRRLEQEQDRCETTLSRSSAEPLAKIIEECLISKPMNEFLAMETTGLNAMIDHDRYEDLSILYQLVLRVDDKVAPLKSVLQSRVMDMGLEIERVLKKTDFSVPQATTADRDDATSKAQPLNQSAQQTAAAIKWVDDVLALKDKFDKIQHHCFNDNLIINSVVTKSFTDFINMFARSSEYVSLFIDDMLKRGIKGKTEAEVDMVLDKAIVLLRYLSDKDLFERYYQKHLARRLLQGKSESQDAEKEMISRMKQAMGNHFTAKFEGMFKDMDLSHDLTKGYGEYVHGLGQVASDQIDLSIHVLTTNNWPPEVMGRKAKENENEMGDCNVPAEISQLRDSFFKYYLKDRSGRVLTWVDSAGTADIKCVFPKIPGKETGPFSKERRYELNVSTYGMVVLLLFNDLPHGATLSFDDIQERTNIPPSDLVRTLASISIAPKSRVLAKTGNPKKIDQSDEFSFNASFVSKTIRIKAPTINSASKVEADDERKETEKKNDQTRAHIIDAAIVRIMKQRKTLDHANLVSEVVAQLSSRFRPDIPMVKARIEDLLAREYLERSEDDSATYNYLA